MARSTKQISITLPNEMADEVRAKVESGEYASESEVIRDGLRALRARDRAVEDWLRSVAAPIHDAMKADPSRGIPMENVRSRLAAEHERATAERRKRQPKR
jgi:putative addiction module CopG family antidote